MENNKTEGLQANRLVKQSLPKKSRRLRLKCKSVH